MAGDAYAPILPGAAIGVFGSGQLGRMLALAARAMGYRIHTFSPAADSPTGQVADREIVAAYDDLEAVRRFVTGVDVVTFEFENVAAHVADMAMGAGIPVRPSGAVLHTAQNRRREKHALAAAGLPVTPFAAVATRAELDVAVERLGLPAVLKTAAFGYDGKGQYRLTGPGDVDAAWQALGGEPVVLERFVDFSGEISVVAARGVDGIFAHYGAIENLHRNHILDVSLAPARIAQNVAQRAVALAQSVLESLDVVGVLCVEFFVTGAGELLINEIAPRPHNSGHLTVDAAVTSQFEQQLRVACALPLGSTRLERPAVMVNLLGDLWRDGTPDWRAALGMPDVKLHLYGKTEPRPGRKMGHLTVLADDVEDALGRALAAREALGAGRTGTGQ